MAMIRKQIHLPEGMDRARKKEAKRRALTEVTQFQPEIEGVRYVNRFAPSLELADSL